MQLKPINTQPVISSITGSLPIPRIGSRGKRAEDKLGYPSMEQRWRGGWRLRVGMRRKRTGLSTITQVSPSSQTGGVPLRPLLPWG